jgi:hypothetical protein
MCISIDCHLLGRDVMWICIHISSFRWNQLPPSSGQRWYLRVQVRNNVHIYLPSFTKSRIALQTLWHYWKNNFLTFRASDEIFCTDRSYSLSFSRLAAFYCVTCGTEMEKSWIKILSNHMSSQDGALSLGSFVIRFLGSLDHLVLRKRAYFRHCCFRPQQGCTGRSGRRFHVEKQQGNLFPLSNTPRRRMGEWSYCSAILDLDTRCRWVVSFTLSTALFRAKGSQEAGWAPEPIWTLWSTEKSLAPSGNWTTAVQLLARHYTVWAISASPCWSK